MNYTITLTSQDLERIESALHMKLNQKIKDELMYDAEDLGKLIRKIEKQHNEQFLATL